MKSRSTVSRRQFLRVTAAGAAAGLAGSSALSRRGLADPSSAQAKACQNKGYQVGIYTRPWSKFDYRVAFDAIADAGFKHAGLMTTKSKTRLVISVETTEKEAAQVADELRQRDLQVPSVYGGRIPVGESVEAGVEGLKRLIDNCAVCEAKSLLMGGMPKEALYEPYYEAIARCCDYAAERGMTITVKPHGGLNATGPQCRKAVERVDHENFGVWYDPGNIMYYSSGELNPVDDASSVADLVMGMCVKDYKPPKSVAITPGTGQVDFPAVMAELHKGGFVSGALVIECLEPGDLAHLAAEAKKARRFVEQLVAKTG
jgi:sugar phosphate isomerase/epimerase